MTGRSSRRCPAYCGYFARSAAIEALRAKYPQYAAHRLEDRPVLRLTVDRVVAWGDLEGPA
jgi:hypothetical protein